MSDLRKTVLKAGKAFKKGNKKAAERHIKQARSQAIIGSPEWVELSVIRALEYGKKCNFPQVKRILDEVSKKKKCKLSAEHTVNLNTLLAGVAENDKDIEGAIEHLKIARATDLADGTGQQIWDLTRSIVRLYDMAKQYDEAVMSIKEVLPKLEKQPPPREHLGMIAHKLMAKMLEKKGDIKIAAKLKRDFFEREVQKFLQTGRRSPYALTDVPPGWGTNELTYYFEEARTNCLWVYANHKDLFNKFEYVNAQFWVGGIASKTAIADMLGEKFPGQKLSTIQTAPVDWLNVFFFLRSHATFLNSAHLCFGGQIAEAYGILRICLEHAFYAYHVARNPASGQIWLDRHKDGEISKAAVRKVFSPGKIIAALIKEVPKLGTEIDRCYELVIDEGAHPNAKTFVDHAQQVNSEGKLLLSVAYLNPGEIVSCAENILKAMEAIMELYRLINPDWIW